MVRHLVGWGLACLVLGARRVRRFIIVVSLAVIASSVGVFVNTLPSVQTRRGAPEWTANPVRRPVPTRVSEVVSRQDSRSTSPAKSGPQVLTKLDVRFGRASAGATVGRGENSARFRLSGYTYPKGPTTSGVVTTFTTAGAPTVRYTRIAGGLKEDIVLTDSAQAARPLDFKVATELTQTHDAGGVLLSRDGAPVYRIPEPFALDASGRRGEVSLEMAGPDWRMKVDPVFVRDADYPITVDPTVLGGDT